MWAEYLAATAAIDRELAADDTRVRIATTRSPEHKRVTRIRCAGLGIERGEGDR